MTDTPTTKCEHEWVDPVAKRNPRYCKNCLTTETSCDSFVGGSLTGLCMECDEPKEAHHKQGTGWEEEFKVAFWEYCRHERLDKEAYITWAVQFIKGLLQTQRESLVGVIRQAVEPKKEDDGLGTDLADHEGKLGKRVLVERMLQRGPEKTGRNL